MGLFIGASLIYAGVALGAWISVSDASSAQNAKQSYGFSIEKSDAQSTIVKFSVTGLNSDPVTIDDQEYIHLSIPELSLTDEKGYPEVPRFSRNILVPSGGVPELTILSVSESALELGTISPSKGSIMRDVNPADVPYTFSSFYSGVDTYPTEVAHIGQPFIMRNVKGVTLEIFPVRYNRLTGIASVVKEMVVEIRTPIQKGASSSFFDNSKSVDDGFLSVYGNRFSNFAAAIDSKDINPTHFIKDQGRVLVVSHESFVEALAPWISWKRQKGLIVKVVTLAETGSTAQSIKAYVQNEFDKNGISYVVLVGDAEFVPFFPGTAGNASKNEADPMYGLVAGNDNYPDLFVSRMSVKTVADVENIITRSINYEMRPELDGDWYAKATGIASAEGDPTDYARAEELRVMLEKWHYTLVDKVYDPGAKPEQLSQALNSGRSFVNYIGHGSKTSWGTTGFSNSDIDQLQNGNKLPFIVSVACVNGDFGAGSDAFAERWLKAGSAASPKGALAVYASSTNQSWVPPTVGQKEIVNILTKKQATTVGGLFFNGVVAVLEDNSSTAAQTFQTWHIFGDATIQVRTEKPKPIRADVPEAISVGQGDLAIKVYEKDIALGIVQNNKLIGRGLADGAGNIKITWLDSAVTGEAMLTFSGFDKVPFVKNVKVR